MSLSNFIAHNDKCRVCSANLILISVVSFWIKQKGRGNFAVAPPGAVIYWQSPTTKKFRRNDISFVDFFEKEMRIIYDNAPRTFTMNGDHIFPQFDLSNVKAALNPKWKIVAIDFMYERFCADYPMHYSYTSRDVINWIDEPWKNAKQKNILNMEQETIVVDDLEITNYTGGNTLIYGPNLNLPIQDGGVIKLPFIPIDKWNVSSKDSLKAQIEKYSLLL